MLKRHKHNWKIKNQDTLPSAYEQLAKAGQTITQWTPGAFGSISDIFAKSVVVTYVCSDCGREVVERV